MNYKPIIQRVGFTFILQISIVCIVCVCMSLQKIFGGKQREKTLECTMRSIIAPLRMQTMNKYLCSRFSNHNTNLHHHLCMQMAFHSQYKAFVNLCVSINVVITGHSTESWSGSLSSPSSSLLSLCPSHSKPFT